MEEQKTGRFVRKSHTQQDDISKKTEFKFNFNVDSNT